jgi:hypothetical protein
MIWISILIRVIFTGCFLGVFVLFGYLMFLIPHESHQLALMMILNTWSSLSKN